MNVPKSLLVLALCTRVLTAAEMTIATVGDSLADAVYLGIKWQPDLVKQHKIKVTRWSRPSIGLTRVDLFDYAAWLRDSKDLGRVDFCVVELGANDLQSIAIGKQKWVAVGTNAWQRLYQERVEQMMRTLKADRCGEVVWLLQPGYGRNEFLKQHNQMMNSVQFSSLQSTKTAAFEIRAGDDDYARDGIHPSGPFSLKLGQAVLKVFASWRQQVETCSSCHANANYSVAIPQEFSPLVLRRP